MSYDERRDPDYQPQYMRKPSIRPANHQLDLPTFWWLFPPLWPIAWAVIAHEVFNDDR